jgi:hypothetical protein
MEHRAPICLVAELQEAGGSLRVQGRELPGHGAARMHHHTAQKVFMRWLLENSEYGAHALRAPTKSYSPPAPPGGGQSNGGAQGILLAHRALP